MKKNGFTLVETLVSLAVLGIFLTSVSGIVNMVLSTVGESQVREQALALAQEKLESIRNLPYTSVGTTTGIPTGVLPETEVTTVNEALFTTTTQVTYVDDPFDSVSPDDSIPTDYKRVRVAVSWVGVFASKNPLVLTTTITSLGNESAVVGGTLQIHVLDAQGNPVTNGSIHVIAPTLNPPVDLTLTTDINGIVTIPGTPVCASCYQISATKTGYSTDQTHGTDEVTNPIKPHATVIDQSVTQLSFLIDELSSLNVSVTRSRESGYSPFSGVQFILRGTKTIGTDSQDNPLYKYQQNHVSGSGGLITINNLEWDTYTVSIPTNSSVDFAGSIPFSPFAISPGTSQSLQIVTTAASANTLLGLITDNNNNPLATASAHLSSPPYTATKSAGLEGRGDFGQMLFSNLEPTIYTLTITHPDYQETSSSIDITGDMKEKIIMLPIQP